MAAGAGGAGTFAGSGAIAAGTPSSGGGGASAAGAGPLPTAASGSGGVGNNSAASGSGGSERSVAGGSGGAASPDTSSFGPAGSPVALHGQLKAQGNQVVDASGNPTQLKGMSLYWSDVSEGARYFDPATVKWLVDDWHVGVIRATIGVRESQGDYLSDPEGQLELLDKVVAGALETGIYVLVDWHDHFARQHTEQAKSFFGKVAEKYGSKPNVMYEIWNEPRGTGAGAATWDGDIEPYAQAISTTLRQRGAHGLMIVGTPFWDQRPDEALTNRVQDENVAYTLHFYAGYAPHFFDNVGGGEVGKHAQAALDGGLPLFVTEFGTTAPDNTSFNEAETRKWIEFLDQKKISYCNWSITAVQEGSAAIHPSANPQGNWSDGDLSQSGKLVRSLIRGN